jgi:hypothetical protein
MSNKEALGYLHHAMLAVMHAQTLLTDEPAKPKRRKRRVRRAKAAKRIPVKRSP